MPIFTHQLPVSAPPDAAWRVLCDVDGYADWVEHTTRMLGSSGGVRVGATYDERSLLLGPVTWRTHWRMVEVVDGRRQVHVGTGLPIVHRMIATFEVEPDPAGCRVRFTLETESRGVLGRIVAAGLGPLLRRRQTRSVVRLADRIVASR